MFIGRLGQRVRKQNAHQTCTKFENFGLTSIRAASSCVCATEAARGVGQQLGGLKARLLGDVWWHNTRLCCVVLCCVVSTVGNGENGENYHHLLSAAAVVVGLTSFLHTHKLAC